MTVQVGLCQTWSETPKTSFLTSHLIFPRCINGGKSDHNEDQATATDLLLTHHFRTDVSTSCLDISLSRSLSHSGGHGGGKQSPGPGSPNRIQSKAPGLAAGSRSKSNDEQEQSSGMRILLTS